MEISVLVYHVIQEQEISVHGLGLASGPPLESGGALGGLLVCGSFGYAQIASSLVLRGDSLSLGLHCWSKEVPLMGAGSLWQPCWTSSILIIDLLTLLVV